MHTGLQAHFPLTSCALIDVATLEGALLQTKMCFYTLLHLET